LAVHVRDWPVLRQLRHGDPLGLGPAVRSRRSATLKPRIDEADHVVESVCPYCAVGCAQFVYVKDGEVTHIEGDPKSPVSHGRLCPKGQASKSYVQSPLCLGPGRTAVSDTDFVKCPRVTRVRQFVHRPTHFPAGVDATMRPSAWARSRSARSRSDSRSASHARLVTTSTTTGTIHTATR
jgi:Molybdopterin oxidoreductase Fe4S4 domain